MEELIKKLKNQLLTGEEFTDLLNEFLHERYQGDVRIQYILTDKDKQEYIWGESGDEDDPYEQTKPLKDGYKIQVKLWQKGSELSIDDCLKVFLEYWNLAFCSDVCGLPETSFGNFIVKCNQTIHAWQKEEKSVACIMLDLDYFKEVNTKHGHETGTRIISEFSRVLFKAVNHRALFMHQSGDEFDLLFFYQHYIEILDLLYSCYKAVKNHKFSVADDVDLTMATGVWILSPSEDTDYKTLRTKAEMTYDPKEKNQGKQRDSIRISKESNAPCWGKADLKLCLVRTIGNSHNDRLFHNIYLDFISQLVSQRMIDEEIQEEINLFLEWVNPKYSHNMRGTISSKNWDTDCEISRLEVGLAVLHGLMRNGSISKNKITFQIVQGCLDILVDERLVFQVPNAGDEELCWEAIDFCKIPESVDVRKTVLVQAGYINETQLPEDLFYKVVYVDARPSIGGGLPDFWAATLAELITSMNMNPNFSEIAICGDLENSKSFHKYLNEIEQWDDNTMKYISKKTFKSYGDILAFQQKFKKHVHVYPDMSDLVGNYFDVYDKMTYIGNGGQENLEKKTRFMKRGLSYDEIKLDISDGCKADTIAQTFPTVLEILRTSSTGRKMLDQAGRELIELTDFKIILQSPTMDKLPDYYQYDKDLVDEYYNNTFAKGNGLFREKLEKKNQLNAMIDHVVSVLERKPIYATRRAILIVENDMEGGRNYSPLGLATIWLAPRLLNQKIVIDYSYTWRTVEAIVGLPFSLYASVRFAEDITEKIIQKATKCDYVVGLGSVTYIAHSLHMFTDGESMNIVRGIINEVSM